MAAFPLVEITKLVRGRSHAKFKSGKPLLNPTVDLSRWFLFNAHSVDRRSFVCSTDCVLECLLTAIATVGYRRSPERSSGSVDRPTFCHFLIIENTDFFLDFVKIWVNLG